MPGFYSGRPVLLEVPAVPVAPAFNSSEQRAGATPIGSRLAVMLSIARHARVKAAECERYAATARDQEIRQRYIELARGWRDMARQAEQLEGDLRDLERKEN